MFRFVAPPNSNGVVDERELIRQKKLYEETKALGKIQSRCSRDGEARAQMRRVEKEWQKNIIEEKPVITSNDCKRSFHAAASLENKRFYGRTYSARGRAKVDKDYYVYPWYAE